MDSLLDIQRKLLPDLLTIMQRRYSILHNIDMMQPVGRRSLANTMEMTERILRSEVDFLKSQNLLSITTVGMTLTEEGKQLLQSMDTFMRDFQGIETMEEQLRRKLNIRKVIIVPGNCDESPHVISEIGKATAFCMKNHLQRDNIIAVTGGSSMAAVAEKLDREFGEIDVVFVPARGGVGEDVKNQANTICAKMAENTGTKHRVLYVPDQVSQEMYDTFSKEPNIHEVLSLIKSSSMVLHGIGDAMTMAKRRRTNEDDLMMIQDQKAVSEAFGYYFNEAGEVIHKVLTIGLQLEDLTNTPCVIAVAGGASKSKAISSYMKSAPSKTILVTDEGAAKKLLKG